MPLCLYPHHQREDNLNSNRNNSSSSIEHHSSSSGSSMPQQQEQQRKGDRVTREVPTGTTTPPPSSISNTHASTRMAYQGIMHAKGTATWVYRTACPLTTAADSIGLVGAAYVGLFGDYHTRYKKQKTFLKRVIKDATTAALRKLRGSIV